MITAGAQQDSSSPIISINAAVILGETVLAPHTEITVKQGDIIGVVGASGCGKTTLLKTAVGVLPHGAHLQGRVEVNGQSPFELKRSSLTELRRHQVAYVGQDPGAELNPLMRVKSLLKELTPHADWKSMLSQLNLPADLAYRRIGEISGGQQRRVALARALLREPSAIILDEPLAGLDRATRVEVMNLLRAIAERGIGILFTGHNLAEVGELSTAIVRVGEQAVHDEHTQMEQLVTVENPTVLTCQRLTLRAPSGAILCSNANFSIRKGEIVGIVGPSGCGKSTFLRTILGRNPSATGQIELLGKARPAGEKIPRVARGLVQLVPQDPLSTLNPKMTARATLLRAVKQNKQLSRSECMMRAGALLDSVGIRGKQQASYPKDLSGGQRQRVSLARAIAPGAPLILCDEVTSALDEKTANAVMATIADLAAQGTAIVLVTHDEALARQWCHRIEHFGILDRNQS